MRQTLMIIKEMGRLKAMEYRIEKDSIGERQVPVDAYYGVQSLRGRRKLPHHRPEAAAGVHQLDGRDQKSLRNLQLSW